MESDHVIYEILREKRAENIEDRIEILEDYLGLSHVELPESDREGYYHDLLGEIMKDETFYPLLD